MRPVCDRAEGMAALARGERGTGITRLRSAATGFERFGVRYEVARTKAMLAHAMPDAGPMLAEAMASAEPLFAGGAGWTDPATSTPSRPDAERLSRRELQVLTCVAQGLDNHSIADRLVISARTVERHLANIYAKLGVSGKAARAAATAHAYETGLIGPDAG
jgi:DNA-binding NarL/FixJ family response regulator